MQVRKSLLDPSNHNSSFQRETKPRVYAYRRRSLIHVFALLILVLSVKASAAEPQRHAADDAKAEQANPAQPAKRNSQPPATAYSRSIASRFGLAFTTSTLGLGADAAFRVVAPVNLRFGFSYFQYGQDGTQDGVTYHGVLSLQSMRTLVDLYPFGQGFHVSPGLLFHNINHVTARAAPPTGTVLGAGNQSFISDPQNPLVGSAKSRVHSIAPMLMVGFGNLVPRKGHFAFSVDVGLVYQGSPKSSFKLAGGACDPTGQFCGNVADDAGIQGAVQSARRDLNRAVSFMRYYPLFSVSVGYHF